MHNRYFRASNSDCAAQRVRIPTWQMPPSHSSGKPRKQAEAAEGERDGLRAEVA